MNFLRRIRVRSNAEDRSAPVNSALHPDDAHYEPPVVLSAGRVRRVTLGSSSSGNADANSQYYW